MQRLKEFMKTTVNQTLCSRGGTVRAALKASFLSHKPFFHHSVTSWIYTNLSQLREVKRRKRKKKRSSSFCPKFRFFFFFYFNPVSLEEIFSSLKFDAVITNYISVCAHAGTDTRTIFNDERRRQRLHVGLAGTRESRILFGLPNATCKLDRLPSLAVFFGFFCDNAADDKTQSLGVSSFPSLHEVFMAKPSPCLYSARISISAALHVTHPGPVSLHLNDRAFILFD